MRDYWAQESLDTGKFVHRFFKGLFLPMILPHSIGDLEKADEAQEIVSRFQPSELMIFDDALWKKWNPIAKGVDKVGGDRMQAFLNFLHDDYYATMQEIEEQRAADIVKNSLENGKFYHSFYKDTFMPLVQPHSIGDPSKAIEAEEISAGMKPSMIPTFDAALWEKWKPIAESADKVGADTLGAFLTFLYDD